MKRHQSGFTLIEIAIVLVIIGLLLGGVLKGQELINSAKVKNLASDFKNIPVYIYGYQDKYKALPGDDKKAVVHVAGILATTPAPATTQGNGIINGNWNSATVTDESYLFWQHIRLAGFGPGSTTPGGPDYISTNAVGGDIGITNSTANSPITNPSGGIKGTYIVCSNGISGKFAKQLDTTLDNGETDSGSVMVTANSTPAGGTAIATALINPDTTYLVCMGY